MHSRGCGAKALDVPRERYADDARRTDLKIPKEVTHETHNKQSKRKAKSLGTGIIFVTIVNVKRRRTGEADCCPGFHNRRNSAQSARQHTITELQDAK